MKFDVWVRVSVCTTANVEKVKLRAIQIVRWVSVTVNKNRRLKTAMANTRKCYMEKSVGRAQRTLTYIH